MAFRWVQKVGRKTARKETAAGRAIIAQTHAHGEQRLREYMADGKCGCGRVDRPPRVSRDARGVLKNAHGHIMTAGIPIPKPRIRSARTRRSELWSLRANNVARDKRGRFKRR